MTTGRDYDVIFHDLNTGAVSKESVRPSAFETYTTIVMVRMTSFTKRLGTTSVLTKGQLKKLRKGRHTIIVEGCCM